MSSVQTPQLPRPRGIRLRSPFLIGSGRAKALQSALESVHRQSVRLTSPPSPGLVVPPLAEPPAVVLSRETTPEKVEVTERKMERRLSFASDYSDGHTPDDCSHCNRRASKIVCRACGHFFSGRMRTECPEHPHVIHLMDIESCPNCKAAKLKEFNEDSKVARTQ